MPQQTPASRPREPSGNSPATAAWSQRPSGSDGTQRDAGSSRHFAPLRATLFRYVWAVLPTKNPNTDAERFFDWVRTSKAAGKIIASAGAVPAFNKS